MRRATPLASRLKILVTGGAGFIGSHIVEALVRRGHAVRVLDDFSGGRRGNLRAVRGDVEVLRGDCADPAAARRGLRGGIEVVYHEAAVPSVARSVDDPSLSHRANATATLTMLAAAREAGVRRFIYAGSSSVYGDARHLPKREDMEPRPLSPYAVGKLTGEHYLRVFHHLYGLETLTLRYFNVFGPRQNPGSPYSGVISVFVTSLLSGRVPVIYGDGLQSRDFTYVADVVQANLRALRARGLAGQHVNVATGHRVTLRQLLDTLARQIGVPARAERRRPRPGDIKHSLADVSAAHRLLGYRPRVDFETGLRRTVEWYRGASATRR
ncbi:MAG TPA: NAD-dependent epimerase/dehydratase family protein [Vicinamibacteria bacterium]|nr:NAD-dependent epimerase/dehydratase family protein [Vicinamibacteria bacterium]